MSITDRARGRSGEANNRGRFLSGRESEVTVGSCGSDTVSAFCSVRHTVLIKRKNFFALVAFLGELKESIKCQTVIWEMVSFCPVCHGDESSKLERELYQTQFFLFPCPPLWCSEILCEGSLRSGMERNRLCCAKSKGQVDSTERNPRGARQGRRKMGCVAKVRNWSYIHLLWTGKTNKDRKRRNGYLK